MGSSYFFRVFRRVEMRDRGELVYLRRCGDFSERADVIKYYSIMDMELGIR